MPTPGCRQPLNSMVIHWLHNSFMNHNDRLKAMIIWPLIRHESFLRYRAPMNWLETSVRPELLRFIPFSISLKQSPGLRDRFTLAAAICSILNVFLKALYFSSSGTNSIDLPTPEMVVQRNRDEMPSSLVAIDTSGSNFNRMSALRQSAALRSAAPANNPLSPANSSFSPTSPQGSHAKISSKQKSRDKRSVEILI